MVAQCNVAWKRPLFEKKENPKLNPSQSALDFLFRFFSQTITQNGIPY